MLARLEGRKRGFHDYLPDFFITQVDARLRVRAIRIRKCSLGRSGGWSERARRIVEGSQIAFAP